MAELQIEVDHRTMSYMIVYYLRLVTMSRQSFSEGSFLSA